ncbi:retrovirus-related pol polyprotein from transposon TNT 1-94 [Tanacetum coccineum]
MARALLFQANFPLHLWGYCIRTTTYLINRLPSRAIDKKSPYEVLYNSLPSLDHLRVIGCKANAYNLTSDKFEPKSTPSVLLGYPQNQKGYIFVSNVHETHSYFQASKDPKWIEATHKEIEALEHNKSLIFVPLPPGKTPIGSNRVFKIKFKANGDVERYKARLVTKGFNQKECIDYKDTFAPVAKMVTVRTLLATTILMGYLIEQLDINTAFLYGDLYEEVYMTIPQGYNQNLPPNTVFKLTKSLYGLKQENRQWFEKLTSFLLQLGFKQSYVDTSLFTITHQGSFTAILVYVDDILIVGKDSSFISAIKKDLHTQFNIKDLGPLNYYLGIEFMRNSFSLIMTQRKYAPELLKYAHVLDSKRIATPLDPIIKLNSTYGYLLPDLSTYMTLVGKLFYLTITRPDLSFAAQALSQYSHSPRSSHFDALIRVLRYIKLCPRQGLFFPVKNNLHLATYCDSDWASCETTRRALADSTCEISWLKSLLLDLQVTVPTLMVMCDNVSTIALANNPIHHARTKHIEIDCDFVREKIRQGQISPFFVPSKFQPADNVTRKTFISTAIEIKS